MKNLIFIGLLIVFAVLFNYLYNKIFRSIVKHILKTDYTEESFKNRTWFLKIPMKKYRKIMTLFVFIIILIIISVWSILEYTVYGDISMLSIGSFLGLSIGNPLITWINAKRNYETIYKLEN